MKDRRLIIDGADHVYHMSIFPAKFPNFQTIPLLMPNTIEMYIVTIGYKLPQLFRNGE